MTLHVEIAVAFASALVSGEFERAHRLLAPGLRSEFPAYRLRDELNAMFEGYAEGPATRISYDNASLEEWPDKQVGDVGWAYVSILGDDFVEGVAVVVAHVGSAPLIRSIEWGRP